jgi:predicted porin
MKRLGVVFTTAFAAIGLAATASAADLPTATAPAAPNHNCWSSFWNWLNASAADCPLGAYGVTLYGTLDVNATYLAQGAPDNPSMDKLFYDIQKSASGSRMMFGYNGLSPSVIGLKMKEDILPYGWSLIGVVEAGVNPYSGMFLNGPRTLADNNFRPVSTAPFQTASTDSNRAGQWDNQQAFIGVSNPTYGTLTFGRTNALSLDVLAAYDPVPSIAFSLIGFSASFPGFGNTETARNTALTYRLGYQNFRAAAQATVGGYSWGNGETAQYQGQIGADFGPLSLDGVVSYAENAVSLSSYSGANTFCVKGTTDCFISVNNALYDPNTVLKATLSNNTGVELAAKYRLNAVTLYAGYLFGRLANPSNDYLGGFPTIAAGIFIPPGYWSKGVYVNNAVTSNAYNVNRILNTVWTGFKWSVLSNLDVQMGFYYQTQNDYNFSVSAAGVTTPAACTGTGAFISSSKCAGSQDAVSLLIDYRPVPRTDLYAGVMLSNVYGALANGFYTTTYPIPGNTKISWNTPHTQNWDPTIGLRIRF